MDVCRIRRQGATTMTQTFSHEAYGHGYLYVKTNGNKYLSMHQRDGMTEMNRILTDLINQAIKETIKNMSK